MKNFLIIFISFAITQAYTQSIASVKLKKEGEIVRITYDLKEVQNGQTFDIELYCSTDDGRSYGNALKAVSGDVGEKIIGGYKTIMWKPMKKNIMTLESDKVKFKVLGKIIDKIKPPNMVFVEEGTFRMGSKDGKNEKPVHRVKISDFHIGKYEVTNAEFVKFLNAEGNQEEGSVTWINLDGNYEKEKCRIQKNGSGFTVQSGYDDYPVIYVSWYGARAYCKWISKTTGKKYRLPTEAEWEYAAGGGNQSKGYTYSGSDTIGNVAWYYKNSDSKIHPVRQKSSNELGIYDMSGNVAEWCSDWYSSDYYKNSPKSNPVGPNEGSSRRVVRGGSWYYDSSNCLVADRVSIIPGLRFNDVGFRVVWHQPFVLL